MIQRAAAVQRPSFTHNRPQHVPELVMEVCKDFYGGLCPISVLRTIGNINDRLFKATAEWNLFIRVLAESLNSIYIRQWVILYHGNRIYHNISICSGNRWKITNAHFWIIQWIKYFPNEKYLMSFDYFLFLSGIWQT